MATCLCDAFYDDVAVATVQVLEYLGCEIIFPDGQTCCGQPAFNAGDWPASRKVVRHTLEVFAGTDPVILPSGSCTAMLRHGNLLAFEKEPDLPAVEALSARTWELADYIVHALKIERWPGKFESSVAFHRSCHSRGTGSADAAVRLLSSIEGLNLVTFGEGEQCCGFGGTFSVAFPHISGAMGRLKLEHVNAAAPRLLTSGDSSCLMHLGGLAAKSGAPLPTLHFVQILRDALVNGGLIPRDSRQEAGRS